MRSAATYTQSYRDTSHSQPVNVHYPLRHFTDQRFRTLAKLTITSNPSATSFCFTRMASEG